MNINITHRLKSRFRKIIEYFPSLALFLRNVRDQLNQRQDPKITPWGFTLAGHEFMASGSFEPQETELVRDLLPQVDLFVNVGANVGYYCCHALSLGKPVIAVEPIANNVHYLLTNFRNNGWSSQVQVFPVALGCSANILGIWGGGTGASLIKGWASIPSSYVKQVPVLTLDRVLGDELAAKRAFILVDIEGAELMMLQGAYETLRSKPRPIWMVEITTTENQPEGTKMNPNFVQTFEMFFNCGYRAYMADERQLEVTRKMVGEAATTGKRFTTTYNYIFK